MTQFLREIHEQPAALRATADYLRPILSTLACPMGLILFTGMGSSFSAATVGAALCNRRGLTALAIETSELLETYLPLVNAQTPLVVISQSGATAEVLALLDRVPNPVIAITNTEKSPLASRSAVCLCTQAGAERTVSSKTYTSALAALSLLVAHWSGDSLAAAHEDVYQLADQIAACLPVWDEHIQDLIVSHASWSRAVFIGRGASYASAMTSALMCQEAAKLPTEGLSGGQFRHGYIESLSPDTAYVLFDHALNRRLAHDLHRFGGSVTLISQQASPWRTLCLPTTAEALRPALEIVPMQLLAAHLVTHLDVEPDVFRYGQKVVMQE